MKIYTTEECQQWVTHEVPYGTLIKTLMFKPKENNITYLVWHLADIGSKCFQHNVNRITQNINKVEANYPNIKPILEDFKFMLCPNPSADTANACANSHCIVYFARSTQIPWCMTDYITAHELGHVVQYKLCDKRNDPRFREYLELRNADKGICTFDKYDNTLDKWVDDVQEEDFLYLHGTQEQQKKYYDWDMNPQEWFAEDFRYLFGTDQGDKYWGLPISKPDDRIKEFMLSL